MIKKRLFEDKINEWYKSNNNQSLVVLGARQVGKTTCIKHWAKENNRKMIYVNFIDEVQLIEPIINAKNWNEIVKTISLFKNVSAKNIEVIFFDEIQVNENLMYCARLFLSSNIKVICSGSLLGLKTKTNSKRTDVGSKIYLELYPLNFKEFLIWSDRKDLVDEIEICFNNMQEIPKPVNQLLFDLFDKYLIVGGMPRAVINYVENDFSISNKIYDIKKSLLIDYMQDNREIKDLNYDYTNININIANLIYEKIDNYIINPKNKRFIISDLNKNYKYKNIAVPLDLLNKINIIFKANKVDVVDFPLEHHIVESNFKLFYSDIGLLTQKLNIKEINLINWQNNNQIADIMGGVIESAVAANIRNKKLFYWSYSINGEQYEVDFLIEDENTLDIIPIEVKSKVGGFKKAKSLDVYENLHKPNKIFCVGRNNFSVNKKRYYIPYYASYLIK